MVDLRQVSLDELDDADISGNSRRILSGSDIQPYEAVVTDRGQNFTFHVFQNTDNPDGPTVFVLHDDEDSAFDVGVQALEKYGGRLVVLESDEHRENNNEDPNRIFGNAYPEYTAFIESMVNPDYPIIAFHTNHDGYNGNGGLGTVSVEKYPNGYHSGGNIVGFDHGDDPDNFVWTASRGSPDPEFVTSMARLGVNVIHERVGNGSDGSLSNLAAHRGYEYYNFEAQHDHTRDLNRIVERAFSVIGISGHGGSQASLDNNLGMPPPSFG